METSIVHRTFVAVFASGCAYCSPDRDNADKFARIVQETQRLLALQIGGFLSGNSKKFAGQPFE